MSPLYASMRSHHVSRRMSSILLKRLSVSRRLSTDILRMEKSMLPSLTSNQSQCLSNVPNQDHNLRYYSKSRLLLDEDDVDGGGGGGEAVALKKDTSKQEKKQQLRKIALEYGRQRASYRRNLKEARKEYMAEYQRHKAEDEAQRKTEQEAITRRRLERQRRKNERSVENARRQVELRRQANLAFEDHLRVQQERRDAHKDLMRQARQLLIDELEEEAPLWMTTPEEVEAAFTHEAEQLLWARPQGVLGVPNPSPDSHFWSYQGHTWDMSKTYKTQSELLLEEMEEDAYMDTNIDPTVWTPERIAEQDALERKAQLRSNVRLEGRKSLLKRQRDFLKQDNETAEGEPPKPMPVPSLGVLANTKALESEGSKLLLDDPTKFFVFESTGATDSQNDDDDDGDESSSAAADSTSGTYTGPSLGTPIDVRDPLRTGQPQGRVFPIGVGKLPKPDLRTEKEKKRQEREERLWAAAQAKSNESDELDLVAEEDREIGEPLDYDANDDWDSDDEEWEKGLDPDQDADILNVPRELRYREQDIDFVIESLENKARIMQSHVRNTIQTMEQEARSRGDRKEEETKVENSDSQSGSSFFDETTVEMLNSVGADVDKYEQVMSSLSREQLLSLFALEADARNTTDQMTPSSDSTSSKAFESIPGLSDEQIVALTELESFLRVAEKTYGASIINDTDEES